MLTFMEGTNVGSRSTTSIQYGSTDHNDSQFTV